MKRIIMSIAILLIFLSFSCNNNGEGNLSIKTTDTSSAFKFEAKYPPSATIKLQKYVDSVLKNNLPLNGDIDLFVNLSGSDKFNFKAKKGWLEITFEKKNTSSNSYMKVKNLSEGIAKKLTEK